MSTDKTVCVDLDGTLCTNTFGEYESAEPLPWAIDRVNRLAAAGHRIIVFTARGTATGIDWEAVTRDQLARWGVTYDELVFGKPSADVYIDDRAVHTDAWRCADISEVPGFGIVEGELPAVLPGHLATVTEIGRTFGGRPLRLDEHAARARELAERAGIRPLPPADELESAVTGALRRAGEPDDEQVFTISISAGGHAGFVDVVDGRPGHHVACRPLGHAARGLGELLVPPGDGAVALAAATRGGPGWPLLEDDGALHDLLGGRLCAVAGETLLVEATPEPASVAAAWVRELAAGLGLDVRDHPIGRADLESAAEALVVGLPFCVLPLGSLDGQQLWAEAPGPVSRRLIEAWSDSAGVDLAAQTAGLLEAA